MNEQAAELYRRACEVYEEDTVLTALRFAEEAALIDPSVPGVHALRAKCLAGIGRLDDALAAVDREPDKAQHAELRKNIVVAAKQQEAKAGIERQWASILMRPEVLKPIEAGSHRYTYRGHPMIKNPFDMALYPLLLWNVKPATIFEIGSYNGASALWMADLLTTYGVDCHIWSLDLVAVTGIQDPRLTFLAGTGQDLAAVFPEEMLASCPRPWLVIDDADHTYKTSKAVLDYFHPRMEPGEYIVVEDGLTAEGPRDAISAFRQKHGKEFAVDTHYCDFFGYNATWCVNGFLGLSVVLSSPWFVAAFS